MLKSASTITINTGNVLNLIDVKKKAGQNVTEELSESIKLTLSEWEAQGNGSEYRLTNGAARHDDESPSYSKQASVSSSLGSPLVITRPHDDVQNKMAEEERRNFKIGVKIFINEDSISSMIECLESVFAALYTDSIDNVILAYNPPASPLDPSDNASQRQRAPPVVDTGTSLVKMSSTETDADGEADALKCDTLLPGIKVLWQVLEDYVKRGRVSQLGVADTGGGCLRKLHSWARVRPSIAQINLASCCVVPPALHAFCRANDVQLLTHADPPDLLTATAAKVLGAFPCESLEWCARYQVHIKCRGVLALKGYVCRATLDGAAR